jgi:hypothetical protein
MKIYPILLLTLVLINLSTSLKAKESCQIITDDEEGEKGSSFLGLREDFANTVESLTSEDSVDPNAKTSTGYFNDLESIDNKPIEDIIAKDLGVQNTSYNFDD